MRLDTDYARREEIRTLLVMFSRLYLLATLLFTALSAFAYEWAANDYHIHSSCQQEWASNFLKTIDIAENERVLDIGCGNGRITSALAADLNTGSAVGLDLSPTMINFAKSHFHRENLKFVQGDGRYLPFENEFDLVVSFTCLHWIRPLEQCFQSVQKSLRPGGRLAACISGTNPLIQAICHTMTQPPWAAHLAHFERLPSYHTAEAIRATLHAAQLEPIRIEKVTEETTFADREAFSLWISQWLASERELPVEMRQAYRDAIIDRYIEQTGTLDPKSGSVVMIQYMTHVVAKK